MGNDIPKGTIYNERFDATQDDLQNSEDRRIIEDHLRTSEVHVGGIIPRQDVTKGGVDLTALESSRAGVVSDRVSDLPFRVTATDVGSDWKIRVYNGLAFDHKGRMIHLYNSAGYVDFTIPGAYGGYYLCAHAWTFDATQRSHPVTGELGYTRLNYKNDDSARALEIITSVGAGDDPPPSLTPGYVFYLCSKVPGNGDIVIGRIQSISGGGDVKMYGEFDESGIAVSGDDAKGEVLVRSARRDSRSAKSKFHDAFPSPFSTYDTGDPGFVQRISGTLTTVDPAGLYVEDNTKTFTSSLVGYTIIVTTPTKIRQRRRISGASGIRLYLEIVAPFPAWVTPPVANESTYQIQREVIPGVSAGVDAERFMACQGTHYAGRTVRNPLALAARDIGAAESSELPDALYDAIYPSTAYPEGHLQDAIDALSGGSTMATIFIKNGEWEMSSTINLMPNIRLFGASREGAILTSGTVHTVTVDTTVSAVNPSELSNLTIKNTCSTAKRCLTAVDAEGLYLDGLNVIGGETTGSHGFYFEDCKNIFIEDCYFEGEPSNSFAIFIQQDSVSIHPTEFQIDSCFIAWNSVDGTDPLNSGGGIKITTSATSSFGLVQPHIVNCSIWGFVGDVGNYRGSGVLLDGGAYFVGLSVIIQNCQIRRYKMCVTTLRAAILYAFGSDLTDCKYGFYFGDYTMTSPSKEWGAGGAVITSCVVISNILTSGWGAAISIRGGVAGLTQRYKFNNSYFEAYGDFGGGAQNSAVYIALHDADTTGSAVSPKDLGLIVADWIGCTLYAIDVNDDANWDGVHIVNCSTYTNNPMCVSLRNCIYSSNSQRMFRVINWANDKSKILYFDMMSGAIWNGVGQDTSTIFCMLTKYVPGPPLVPNNSPIVAHFWNLVIWNNSGNNSSHLCIEQQPQGTTPGQYFLGSVEADLCSVCGWVRDGTGASAKWLGPWDPVYVRMINCSNGSYVMGYQGLLYPVEASWGQTYDNMFQCCGILKIPTGENHGHIEHLPYYDVDSYVVVACIAAVPAGETIAAVLRVSPHDPGDQETLINLNTTAAGNVYVNWIAWGVHYRAT